MATYFVIYFDNLGIQPCDSGYMQPLTFYKTKEEVKYQLKLTVYGGYRRPEEIKQAKKHYSIRKVEVTIKEVK